MFYSRWGNTFSQIWDNDSLWMFENVMVTGGGGDGEMANLTNEKGKFAIAIFRHFSPLVVFEIKYFRHQGN